MALSSPFLQGRARRRVRVRNPGSLTGAPIRAQPTFAGLATCLTALIAVGHLEWETKPLGLLNLSPSEPPGFYLRSNLPIAPNRLVAFHPPAVSRRVGDGHLARYGSFLKRVGAVGGDKVCSDGHEAFINGVLAGGVVQTDADGRALPHWRGCKTLSDGEIFVLSNRVPNSFDSRYFGPIAVSQVIGVYRPLWIRP